MISLIRTLTATSIDGFPLLLLNLDDIVMMLAFGETLSEQTAAITSRTSTGFNLKGCCSLNHIKTYCERRKIETLIMVHEDLFSDVHNQSVDSSVSSDTLIVKKA